MTLGVLATLLMAGLGGIAVWRLAASDEGLDEVALEPIAAAVPDPFTDPVTARPETTPPTTTTSMPAGVVTGSAGGVSLAGSAPGLYGGTRNEATCDPDLLVRFLEANPPMASAWAGVQGISPAGIRTYVSSLTSVVLTRDTAVLNHGYANGRATPRPAVLQAGTAVMVDRTGTPRVKCGCGNPLAPPRARTGGTRYTGPRWPGFQPATTVTVDVDVTVETFVLVDLAGGSPFGRRPGSNGGSDREIGLDEYCRLYPDAPACVDRPPATGPPPTDPQGTEPPVTSPPPTIGTGGRSPGDGDVRVSLTWGSDSDLDLHVIDPDGSEISFASRRSPSGGELDVDDIPASGDVGSHLENVFWPTGGAPAGTYTAYVRNLSGQESGFDLAVFVAGARVAGTSGALAPSGESERVVFAF